jgi:hypothetical protein
MVKINRLLKSNGFLSFLTGIMVGVMMGTAIMSILAGFRMEYYYRKIKLLESVIEDKEVQLVKLGDSINKHKYILKGIEVFLIYEGDDLDKIALEKYIKEKYRPLLGKRIGDIDTDLVVEVIDKRIFKLDKDYRLKVSRVILTETLKISVEVVALD